jgi:uncharacterized membrane protein YfcA
MLNEVPASGLLAAFGGAFLAGAINSVAGGGTLISFPVLLALGLPPVIANATNTMGIWPGSFGSIWGFRREISALDRRLFWFLVPALVGSLTGAWLLRISPPQVFEKVVPWMLLFATFLFSIQSTVQKRFGSVEAAARLDRSWLFAALVLQFGVAVYGGYFGAGMSIMALSILGLLGMTDLLEMSATTSLLGFVINGAAAACFALAGLIHWPCALSMTLGALAGGYGAVGIARRIGKMALRRFVICVGVLLSTVLLVRTLSR